MAISKDDVQKFAKGELWERFITIVDDRESVIREELLNQTDVIEIYRLQGAAGEVAFLRSLPEALITEIENDEYEAKMKQEESEEKQNE